MGSERENKIDSIINKTKWRFSFSGGDTIDIRGCDDFQNYLDLEEEDQIEYYSSKLGVSTSTCKSFSKRLSFAFGDNLVSTLPQDGILSDPK